MLADVTPKRNNMKYIKYNLDTNSIDIDDDLWLIKEFRDLQNPKRNITKTDKTGQNKELVQKELVFMAQYYNWTSPYRKYTEAERFKNSVSDSELTEKQLEDPLFKLACKKYEELHDNTYELRLLKANMKSVESIIYYFDHLDINERDPETGKPVFKTKDVIAEIKGASDLIKSIRELEERIKEGMQEETALRGDKEAGFFD